MRLSHMPLDSLNKYQNHQCDMYKMRTPPGSVELSFIVCLIDNDGNHALSSTQLDLPDEYRKHPIDRELSFIVLMG